MHFPLFIDLADRPCLVVGAGSVAERKVRVLNDFGARVFLVAPEVNRPFAEADLDGRALVVAATDDAALNARIARLCRARGILVNVVDDPGNCTFIFPAYVRKGPLTVAVSSGGTCPVAAQIVRDRAAPLLTERLVQAVERLGAARESLKRAWPDSAVRRERMRKELEQC